MLPTAEAVPRRKIVVKSADMEEAAQKEAIDCAVAAVEQHREVKDIAEYIKKQFDRNHGASWHCIVGSNFGSYVTHEANHFIYFYLDQRAILLFKSG